MSTLRLSPPDYQRTDAGDGRQLGHICNPAEGQQRLLAALLRIEDHLAGRPASAELVGAEFVPDPGIARIADLLEEQNRLLAEMAARMAGSEAEPARRGPGRPPKAKAE